MPNVPGLRSPYDRVGRLVLFGRVLDKIRLHAAGKLPAEYVRNLGEGHPLFADGRVCRFLGVTYADLRDRVLHGGTDEEVLGWAEATGGRRSDEECEVWNSFVTKLGWRDRLTEMLRRRAEIAGVADQPIETVFDLMDYDEGRDPVGRRAWQPASPLVIVLMGVAGSGKTTIGQKLALALGWPFRDADDFHSVANVAKMSSGVPLDDHDRGPWLRAIRDFIEHTLAAQTSAIVACSALREEYRRVLLVDPARVKLVHLAGDFALILERLRQRQGHFMRPEMLESQFATLETPTGGLTIDTAQSPEAIVAEIRRSFSV